MASSSTGSEQQLRFRWNDHMQHISKVLTLQRFEEQFCDVTLVSEDGFVMKAHQAILASTSAYFQRVFSDITADQHPMVVLRGANFREMSCLLDYMYQGSTQVHQSLMESVLEVADMLEVKGLSQIRSNNSIKKFMVPPSSSITTSTTTTHVLSGDNNVVCPRSPDEQSGTLTPEEQMYRDSQPRTAELESTWMRFSGNNVSETRSKETVRTHVEGPLTPTEEPPPPTHARMLQCQDSSNQETQEESQMSGMDLSMAKNEPWSPKESTPCDDKNSPTRKRRKLLEGICSEETLEPVSDPDWGRIGSKVDDRPLCQPRTISFTSITSETESHPDDVSYNEEKPEGYREPIRYQPKSPVHQVSCNELPISATSYMQHPSQVASKEECKEVAFQSAQFLTSSSKDSATCPCKGPCKSSVFKVSQGTQDSTLRNEISFSKDRKHSDMVMEGQFVEKDYHPNHVILGYCATNQGTNMLMQSSDGIADQNVLRSSFMNDACGSPVVLSVPSTSCCIPILSQNPMDDGTDNLKTTGMHDSNLKRCEVAPEGREGVYREAVAESSMDNPQPLHLEKASETAAVPFEDKASNNAIAEEAQNYNTNCIQDGVDNSHSYVIEQRQPPNTSLARSIEMSSAGLAVSSPVQLIYCSSVSSTSKASHRTEDYLYIEPLNANSEDTNEDPLQIPVYSAVNTSSATGHNEASGEETPITSFVSLNRREHLVVRDADHARKAQCLLEERLLKPKNDVKRPMNPYMLFQNEMKKKVMADNPGEPYQVTLKRLGYLWKHLIPSERAKWQARADDLKKEHKRQNPDYQYNPYEAFKKRQQYLKARLERSRLYRVASENSIGGDTDTVMVSPNLYKPLTKD